MAETGLKNTKVCYLSRFSGTTFSLVCLSEINVPYIRTHVKCMKMLGEAVDSTCTACGTRNAMGDALVHIRSVVGACLVITGLDSGDKLAIS